MAVYRASQAPQDPPKRKRGKKPVGCIVFLLFLLLVVAGGVMAFSAIDGEIHGKNAQEENGITLTIEQGSGLSTIAAQLKEAGVIRYPQIFKLYVKGQSGAAGQLQYGEFQLYEGMSYKEIVHILTSQVVAVESVRLTFPEGTTALDIAQQMELAGLCTAQEFLETADTGDFSQFEFWNKIEEDDRRFFKCEGYLFPDTYDFAVEGTVYDYVATFYARFDEQVGQELYDRMDQINLPLSDTITLASFVQEEAGNEEDAHVSAVFHNRLVEDSPYPRLESNASSYVENPEDNNYLYNWIADYYGGFDQIPPEKYAAYNTYSCEGLPAGPISNPGLEAIRAALYPDKEYLGEGARAVLYPGESGPSEGYYFFVTDLNGKYYYGKTAQEHAANVDTAYGVNASLGH